MRSTIQFLKHFPGHQILISMKEDNSAAPIHYHDELSKCKDTLKKKNDQGDTGIFFTVNLLDESKDKGRHRTKKMVKLCRSVFMDDDNPRDTPRTDFPLVPSLIVNTSPGKYHYYWLIEDGTDDFETWQLVQNGIINLYDGDSNAKDLTRYLRLPGYKHNKNDAFMVTYTTNDEKYSWGQICECFPPDSTKTVHNKESGLASSSESKSIQEHIDAITSGANYHGSIVSICHQMKMDGVNDAFIAIAIKGAMMACSPELRAESRWINRYADIDRDILQYNPTEEIDVPELSSDVEATGMMPWPPGAFGDLAKDAYNMARFQYREVAIISALGLVAGVCGRKFNAEGAGLNIYATLIMDTGMGKDSISKFIKRALMNANDVGTGSSFDGPVRFTGPRAVFHALESARSQVCVFTEAGLLLNSKAGDGDGLKRVLLGLYTKSGQHDYSGTEMYSDQEKGVKSLRAPALSIINESTPEMLLSVFKKGDGLRSGDIPRQLIYRIHGEKPDSNRNHHKNEISQKCFDKLKHLIGKCSAVQAVDDPKAWDMIPDDAVEDDMLKTEKYWVKVQNENRQSNSTKYAMATRAYYKAVRLAAIASVFNHLEARISWPEWIWAKEMIEFEMNGLSHFFRGGGMGDPIADLVTRHAIPVITRILNDSLSIRNGMSKKDHKAGKFKLYEFTQALKNNQEVTDLADKQAFNLKSGQQKLIEYMISNDMLMKLPNNRSIVYQVTDTFLAYCE